MDDRAHAVLLLTRMFDAYGQAPSPSRIDVYLDVIGNYQGEPLREGIRDAMREAGDFPPGPGTVRRCAIAAFRTARPDPVPSPRLPGVDYAEERRKIAEIINETKGALQ